MSKCSLYSSLSFILSPFARLFFPLVVVQVLWKWAPEVRSASWMGGWGVGVRSDRGYMSELLLCYPTEASRLLTGGRGREACIVWGAADLPAEMCAKFALSANDCCLWTRRLQVLRIQGPWTLPTK